MEGGALLIVSPLSSDLIPRMDPHDAPITIRTGTRAVIN